MDGYRSLATVSGESADNKLIGDLLWLHVGSEVEAERIWLELVRTYVMDDRNTNKSVATAEIAALMALTALFTSRGWLRE